MKQRAVIYARFSSHSQTEQSIEGQLRECYAYAKRNNLIIVGEYIDRALSGTTDKRPEFLKMIEDSKSHDFDFVLVYQLDRFARNRYDSATYKAKLKKNNVRVISAKENISNDASGVLMESVLEGMAEYYSAELSQKVKRGLRESLMKGNYIGGYILYGYDVVDKKYVLNESESAIVRNIFESYTNGKKIKEIVDDLNNKGLKTKNGYSFSINIISKMIRNIKYTGKCVIDGEEYNNVFPPIIDENTFRICNEIMNKHKHRQRTCKEVDEIYILSGKLYCGECYHLMTAETGTSATGRIYKYYKCSGKKKKLCKCNKHNVKKDDIENFVFEKTKKFVLEPKVIDSIAEVVVSRFNSEISENAILAKLKEELKTKDKAINAILDALEKGICTKSTQERLLKLENEKEKIEEQIAYEEAHQIKPLEKQQIINFLNIYAKKKFNRSTDRNDFFNNFITKVVLYDDKITIMYNTSLNPGEEIYHINTKNDTTDDNDDGTTIYNKEVEIIEEENKKLPFEFKRQSSGGANAPEFEPFDKNKTINPEKEEFETKNGNIHTLINETKNEKEKTNSNTITTKAPNEELKTEVREELNTNIESKSKTKNVQTAKTKTKNNATSTTIQKFSNHIIFIDYIPTHELITYRHLFAYGFYVE